METARCRAVLAAAETGSFSRAAEVLRYTPSGVNQLVTAFENELGFSGISPQHQGREPDGKRPAAAAHGAGISARRTRRPFELSTEINGLLIGTVTIAAYSSIATHWLPAVIRDFQENYPHVEIKLMEGIWQEVSQWLEERTADIGFLSYQENMPSGSHWPRTPCWPCCPRNHPLAGADCYPLKRCEQDSFIMPALGCDDDVEALFARNHVDPNIRYTTIENFSAMSMVEQVWQETTTPGGDVDKPTAEEVLFTCWPPAPLERNTCISISSGRISISPSSSISGMTSRAEKLVCRRALASKGTYPHQAVYAVLTL